MYAIKKIEELSNLKNNWDGLGAIIPNKDAIIMAKKMVDILYNYDLDVNWVKPFVKGGIDLLLISNDNKKWCKIKIDNDKDIGICLSNGDIWFIIDDFYTIEDSLDKIKGWLNG